MTARAIVQRVAIERTRADGSVERQEVTYSEPWRLAKHEWRCAVDLPFMNHAPFEITGIDAKHAEKQARWFAGDLMRRRGWRRVDAD